MIRSWSVAVSLVTAVAVGPELARADEPSAMTQRISDPTRFVAGVSLGVTQAEANAEYTDANHTLGLFARGRLTRRLSAQLEVTRLTTDDDSTTIRVYSVTATLDLSNHPHLVPMLLVGTGLDRQSTSYGTYTNAHHFEGGVALEYRADGGFTAGADVRLGGRTIDEQTEYILDKAPPNATLFAPAADLPAGQYRSARLYAGIRF